MGNGWVGLERRTVLKGASALLAAPAISRAAGTGPSGRRRHRRWRSST